MTTIVKERTEYFFIKKRMVQMIFTVFFSEGEPPFSGKIELLYEEGYHLITCFHEKNTFPKKIKQLIEQFKNLIEEYNKKNIMLIKTVD